MHDENNPLKCCYSCNRSKSPKRMKKGGRGKNSNLCKVCHRKRMKERENIIEVRAASLVRHKIKRGSIKVEDRNEVIQLIIEKIKNQGFTNLCGKTVKIKSFDGHCVFSHYDDFGRIIDFNIEITDKIAVGTITNKVVVGERPNNERTSSKKTSNKRMKKLLEQLLSTPFQPSGLDTRKYETRSRPTRTKQKIFRKLCLLYYGAKCAFTGCSIPGVLEAIHLESWNGNNDHPTNSLPARVDVHRLVDKSLIGVNPDTMTIVIKDPEIEQAYQLNGKKLQCDVEKVSHIALQIKWNEFSIVNYNNPMVESNEQS